MNGVINWTHDKVHELLSKASDLIKLKDILKSLPEEALILVDFDNLPKFSQIIPTEIDTEEPDVMIQYFRFDVKTRMLSWDDNLILFDNNGNYQFVDRKTWEIKSRLRVLCPFCLEYNFDRQKDETNCKHAIAGIFNDWMNGSDFHWLNENAENLYNENLNELDDEFEEEYDEHKWVGLNKSICESIFPGIVCRSIGYSYYFDAGFITIAFIPEEVQR
jgi:hypothetical protein